MAAASIFGVKMRIRLVCRFAVFAFVATITCFPAVSRGAELVDSAKSLSLVPASAAFYSASLRLQEQFDIFLGSRTYERLMQVPVVQLAKMQIVFQWEQSQEPGIVQVREYFKSPDGQRLTELLHDMFDREVFVYGSQEWAPVLTFLAELNGMSRQIQLDAVIAQKTPEESSRALAETFKERIRTLEIPQTVIGFRITNAAQAIEQLDYLQTVVVDVIKQKRPELESHVQREEITGHPFVTLRLDGSLLPWDQMRSGAENEVDDATFNEWRDLFSQKKFVVAVGVVDDFLLVFAGNSTDYLANLGQSPLLAEGAALSRLKPHADKRITSLAYASAAIAKSVNSPRANLEGLVALAESGLLAAPLEEQRRKQVLADISALADNLATYLPQPGAFSSVTFLTQRGFEGYQYRNGSIGSYDSSQPLTLLDHAGSKPLFLYAGRSKHTVEQYDQTIAVVSRVALDAEEIAEKIAPPEKWAEYQTWRPKILPLLVRLNTTTRDNLYPALADGQVSIVVDAGAESKQWQAEAPPAEQPLPMLELALVGSVSDVARLRAAVVDYFQLVQDTMALMHEADPTAVPNVDLPRPNLTTTKDATTVSYELPVEWRLDEQIEPNASLTSNIWAVSLFPTYTSRLLESRPLELDSPIDVRRPAAIVAYAQFPKLLDAIGPWVDYGFEIAAKKAQEQGDDPQAATMPAGFILPQVHQLLEVVAAIQSYTSVTYVEDDVWVTHSELHVVDVK